MKTALLSLSLLCSAVALSGQGSFSTDEALKQLYHDYDPATRTAQWVCTKEQQREGPHTGWRCIKEDTTVSVSVILMAQVPEGDATRIYLATSAKPAHDPMGEYNCHACAPAIGAAVFVWQSQHWALESANVAIEFSQGWGEPPEIYLVVAGPQEHGLVLSSNDLAQGFAASGKELLLPVGKTVEAVWSIGDESDAFGKVDPTDKANSPPPYRSSAAFRFLSGDDGAAYTGAPSDYYDIEVISRGSSWEDYNHPVKRENWSAIYSFKNGKYRLVRKTSFAEVKNSGKPRTDKKP